MPKSRGGGGDSGVSARMEGSFLTAMNDMKEQVVWCFTANDVKNMHEAFFRAERVDGVFYVRLPGAEQRSALWRLYTKKFFPKEVVIDKQTVPYPGYVSLDVDSYLEELSKTKKIKPDDWAMRLLLPFMALNPDKRAVKLEKLKDIDENVFNSLILVDDEGWSPAEIRSCCRLARKLKESVGRTKRRIRPVSLSASKVIISLEEWAAESALDAETGEIYRPMATETEEDASKTENRKLETGKKVRRKVRKVE